MALEPLRKTLVGVGLAIYNVGMFAPRVIGRMSREITRGIKARAASKRQMDGPIRDLWLVVGLGNPGTRYDGTRHNVGFRTVDEIARANGISLKKAKANAQVGLGQIAGEPVMLVKPLTFMNLSGESVGKLSRYYKVPRAKVLVIYDDLDLPTAAVKLKLKGGHGGHNGMRSIIEHFGGKNDFPRLRIGIGRPRNKRIPIATHVLQRFAREEEEDIDFALTDCVKIVEAVMVGGMDRALSTMNPKKKGGGQAKKKKEKEKKKKEEGEEPSAGAPATAATATTAEKE